MFGALVEYDISLPNEAYCSGAMGVFWLSLGIAFVPSSGVTAAYSESGDFLEGFRSPAFNADAGTYLVCWGLVTFIILICSIKTNIASVILFACLDAAFFIFAASYFQLSYGNNAMGVILQKVSFFGDWRLMIGGSGLYICGFVDFVLPILRDYV